MAGISGESQVHVAKAIYDSELIKFGEFELKSGIKSPFYIDLRKAQSHPIAFRAIVDAYGEMLKDINSDTLIAGVPEAATPIAGAVGYATGRALVQPRKVVKEHGTKNSIEGDFNEGDKVVLIDDLITKGDSKLEVIEQVEDAGLEVEKFIVLVDREQGGMETVRNAGYDIQAGLSITALIDTLYSRCKIESAQREQILEFINNN